MKAAAELRRQVSAANRKAWETKSSSTWRAGRGQVRARSRCAAAVDLGTTGGRSQGPARHGRHVTPSRQVTPSHVAAPIFVDKHTVLAAWNEPRVVASRALPPRAGGRAHPRNGCMPARVGRRRGRWIRLRSPRRARAPGSGARAGSRPCLRGPERILVG